MLSLSNSYGKSEWIYQFCQKSNEKNNSLKRTSVVSNLLIQVFSSFMKGVLRCIFPEITFQHPLLLQEQHITSIFHTIPNIFRPCLSSIVDDFVKYNPFLLSHSQNATHMLKSAVVDEELCKKPVTFALYEVGFYLPLTPLLRHVQLHLVAGLFAEDTVMLEEKLVILK